MNHWPRRAIIALAFALIAGIVPAFAQAPPPVPALPDAERRTSYTITASTCACAVGFSLYGDSTDYANWLTVWVNGVQMSQSGNWTITSPSGAIATLPRPITDAVLTFTAAQTGTVQIVGARRPRRTNTFTENRGVAARDQNQILNDFEAQLRELWDRQVRTVQSAPGETMTLLPPAATRANNFLFFDSGGNPSFASGAAPSAPVTNPNLAPMPAGTIKCNNATVSLAPADCTQTVLSPPSSVAIFPYALGFYQNATNPVTVTGASSELDMMRCSQAAGGFNQYTITGASAQAACLMFQMESLSGSVSTSNMYGVIGNVQNDGPGTVKGVYGRATSAPGSTGTVVGLVSGITTSSTTGNAYGVQISGDTYTNTSAVPLNAGVWLTPNDGVSTVKATYGLLLSNQIQIQAGGAALQASAQGAGNFLTFLNAPLTLALFSVDKLGNTVAEHYSGQVTLTPTMGACGTGSSFGGNANDVHGKIIAGTGTFTSCTITWQTARATGPDCVVSSPTGATFTGYVPSTTGLVINNTANITPSAQFTYICMGQ